jgi:hypothetical protein
MTFSAAKEAGPSFLDTVHFHRISVTCEAASLIQVLEYPVFQARVVVFPAFGDTLQGRDH